MSISLNATLQTAQDGISHAPRCKILSSNFINDIPFDGNLFNYDDTDENFPSMIETAVGRICCLYVRGNDLYLYYSDTDKTTWTSVLIYDGDDSGHPAEDGALIELADGNLGVLFSAYESSPYLYSMVISQIGIIVQAVNERATWSSSYYVYSSAIVSVPDGFLIFYVRWQSGVGYTIRGAIVDSDFVSNWTWTGEISISGLVAGRKRQNVTLLKADSGRLYVFFDYVDDFVGSTYRYNIYYSYSIDNGSSWSAASQLTSYDDYVTVGRAPHVSEQSSGDIAIAYHEIIGVLEIDDSTSGWCYSPGAAWEDIFLVSRVFYIDSSDKLIVFGQWTGSGGKEFHQMLVVDVSTWTIDKCYNQAGAPGFNEIFISDHVWTTNSFHSAGKYAALCVEYKNICVFDIEAETATQYHFETNGTYGVTKNIDYTWQIDEPVLVDNAALFIDEVNNRLYICRAGNDVSDFEWEVGYIDLTETADPATGLYSFNYIAHVQNIGDTYANSDSTGWFFNVNVTENKFIVGYNSEGASGDHDAYTWVYTLSGAEYKVYNNAVNAGVWYYGMFNRPIILNNIIYAPIGYSSLNGQSARRGLMLINMNTDVATYERPTYDSIDDYNLTDAQLIDNDTRIMFAGTGTSYGGAIFYDIQSKTWTRYNGSDVNGFFGTYNSLTTIAYSAAGELIFAADGFSSHNEYRVVAFKEGGNIFLGKYITGAVNGDHYDFAVTADLHRNFGGHNLTVAYDSEDSFWNIWSDAEDETNSLKWDRSGFSPDLSGFLPEGSIVQISWEIDKPATASFQLARGDLFDPTNTASIYSVLCQKGRKITISFGEKISGTTYWQQQGVFILTSAQITYNAREHPVVSIRCEDLMRAWDDMVITATESFFNIAAAVVIESILEDYGNLESAEHSIISQPTFHALYSQWVDESLIDIMQDILDHFGCFGRFGQDNVYEAVYIDLTAVTDHDYTGESQTPLINYTPDDSMSSQINRVTVKCEGRQPIEVIWDEERIDIYSGTVGFWSKEPDIRAYYSDDRTRKCRYPRLNVLESINNYPSFISMIDSNGDEYISNIDTNETYSDIKIEAPDRGLYVFGFAALVAGLGISALGCDGFITGVCGYFIMSTNLAMSALISSMTASQYRYELWARPIGHEFEMYQSIANDTELQVTMNGLIVNHDIEDALAYTVAHCYMVANQELAVVKAQRRRVQFGKVAHLQDEVGDIIEILHPISGLTLKVYIAKLVRSYSTGASGKFIDSIDGWRIIG